MLSLEENFRWHLEVQQLFIDTRSFKNMYTYSKFGVIKTY